MAYSPSEKYPGAVDVDPDYQSGKFRDNNPSTTNNGSPLKAIDRNELLARDEAIMNDAGFEYSGVADTPQDSQLFKAYKASLGNGANLLSNHNFLIQTPDDSQPLPSATPTSYPPGYQIFSGVFANETTGITNLTYIDGRVSFSGGNLYFSVPNTGGVERLTAAQLTASVADFDGKPRTRGVSFALVGDDYRVTVGIDALEDAGAELTPLGSVKFEQGSVATGHDVSSGNLSDYSIIAYEGVSNMVAGIPVSARVGARCNTGSGSYTRVSIANGDISDFEPVGDLNIMDFITEGVDNTASFISAINYANSIGADIVGDSSKVILLTGSDDIVVKVGFNLGGCEIDAQNFSGTITFSSSEPVINYAPGSAVVDNLLTEPTLSGNKFAGWGGVSEVSDSYVVLQTSQPFYTYRNVEKTRIEYNKSIAFGILESNLKYDLASNLVTGVRVQKISDKISFAGNFVLNVGNRDDGEKLIRAQDLTLGMLGLIRFKIGDDVLTMSNPQLIEMSYCCNVELYDIYCQRPIVTSAGTGFTYNVAMANSYDVRLNKVKSIGDGWGATGNNSCQKISFYDCTLSRIDFHEPFREFLDVDNCIIGSWGILVSALGDLTVNRTKFLVNSDNTHVNNDGIIRTRADTGGFCDGDLIVRNSKIESDKGIAMFQHTASSGNPKPTGSPIGYIAWNNITYQNLRTKGANIVSLAPIVNGAYGVNYPYSVIVTGCKDGLFAYSVDLSDQNPIDGGVTDGQVMNGDYNHKIDLTNSTLVTSSDIKVVDQTADNFRVLVNIDDCSGPKDQKELIFLLKCNADVNIDKSVISEFSLIDSGINTKPLNVAVSNTRWNFISRRYSEPMLGHASNRSPSNLARFIVSNSYLYHATLAETSEFGAAKLNNCLFWNGSIYSSNLDYGSITAGEISFSSKQDTTNNFELIYNGTYSASFNMVGISENKYLQLSDTESVRFVRAASEKLTFTTVTGSPVLGSIRLI